VSPRVEARESRAVITSPRTERAGLEFPDAVWTSFDRYSRYGSIARALRAAVRPGARVLDVGDPAGYLSVFAPELATSCIDLTLESAPLPGAERIVGNGSGLPFADATFDAVVSSDTLEHVGVRDRLTFLHELARVARDVLIVSAPFDTPGVAGAEELVRRFVLLATGSAQEQLDEHREHGLPDLTDTNAVLRACGFETRVVGDGNLHDWVGMMLLKHQLAARPALGPLDAGYDILYNSLFASRARVAPYYRHMIVARRDGDPDPGAHAPAPEGVPADLSAVLSVCLAANVAEAVRQDNVPKLDGLERRVTELQLALEQVRAEVAVVRETDAKVDRLLDLFRLVRHPLRRARGAVTRRAAE
jgi:SAM-dependent methyltransferase